MRLCLLLAAAAGARARLAPRERERARLTGGRRLSDSSSFAQLVKMTASDAAANDYFGTSVAVDGGTIVVGAWSDDDGGSSSGSAYVLRASDGAQLAKLTASDAANNDRFGTSVAIDGDTIVVGASGVGSMAGTGGKVYVFRKGWYGDTYDQVATLTASDAATGDYFGRSVAIDGNTIVVGAYEANSDRGSVYVYRTSDGGATYAQVAKLTAADAATGDKFGYSVAIEGDTIVVGAYRDGNTSGAPYYVGGTGAAYVYRTTDGGATYNQVAKLTASDAASYDYFGCSVAIDGDTIVVGAYQFTTGPGKAYIFQTDDGGATYGQVAKLTASDAEDDDYFGWSVAIDGATIVVAAKWDDDAGDKSGSAYVFRSSDGWDGGTTYDQVAKLTAADGAANDAFGGSVAIDGDTIVVGACCDDDGGSNSGSAYVFEDDSGWFGAGWFGSSSQKSNGGGVADDDKMMTLVVLAALLGLSLAIAAGLFALRQQQQLAAKKPRAPRTFTVTAVQSA